jgi:hypothetical protein
MSPYAHSDIPVQHMATLIISPMLQTDDQCEPASNAGELQLRLAQTWKDALQ